MVGESMRHHENRNETFMVDRIDEFFGDSRNTRSERHGFGRLTKNQLTGFMVGTMKGFMVNEAEFAGSTPIPALRARARGETPAQGVHGWHHEPLHGALRGVHGGPTRAD